MKLHIVFLSGINLKNADEVTSLLRRFTTPDHDVCVVGLPSSFDHPRLMGVVVLDDNSKTTMYNTADVVDVENGLFQRDVIER